MQNKTQQKKKLPYVQSLFPLRDCRGKRACRVETWRACRAASVVSQKERLQTKPQLTTLVARHARYVSTPRAIFAPARLFVSLDNPWVSLDYPWAERETALVYLKIDQGPVTQQQTSESQQTRTRNLHNLFLLKFRIVVPVFVTFCSRCSWPWRNVSYSGGAMSSFDKLK